MLPFNKPPITGHEVSYIKKAITENAKLCGDGPFTKKCQEWFEKCKGIQKVLLTPSCTAALELAAILIDIKPGDEVIMPSYTFVSTANAFVLRGARIIFVDIRPDTMNIDENKIEAAITKKTKAIVPMHYAGIACEMDVIMTIAHRHQLLVIEDAAQGVMASYNGYPLGSIGHLGCYSFHETKNYTSGGEGGALLINDSRFLDRAEIIREKGTNRTQYLKGQVDKYTWRDLGSSFLLSEVQAAYLFAQLESAQLINQQRFTVWSQYHNAFELLELNKRLSRPRVPDNCEHNAHMYYIKVPTLEERIRFIDFMRDNQIQAQFHYVPLHSSPAGKKFGKFFGVDVFTTLESQKLIRLPLWYGLSEEQVHSVILSSNEFFQ